MAEEETNINPFADATVVEGLEHLGAGILDSNGVPSGSPANWEKTRGKTGLKPVDVASVVESIKGDASLELPE